MSGDERAPGSRGPRRLRLGIAVVALGLVAAAGVWFLSMAGGSPLERSPGAGAPEPAIAVETPSSAAAPVDPPELPEGSLPPILGEPRLDRIDYCDERNWRRVDTVVRDFDGDVLVVDESAWQNAGASTRVGLAGWASKCRLDGRALVVRAEGSGHELGAYDPAFGYEMFD